MKNPSETALRSIEQAHNQLLKYTEEAPKMLEQVDSQQFTKLGVKYHHLLMKFERSKALLKKRMDMHADLDNIVLQSPTVQAELRLIEEIEQTRGQLRDRKAVVEDGLAQCRREIEETEREMADLKKVLFQQKHEYFEVRLDLQQIKQNALPPPLQPARKIFPARFSRQGEEFNPGKRFSQSSTVPTQAQAISTLMVGLRMLQKEMFRTAKRNVRQVIKNTRILRTLKSSVKENHNPKGKRQSEQPIKKTTGLPNSRTGVLADFHSKTEGPGMSYETLKKIKSGLAEWPSEWLLQDHSHHIQPPNGSYEHLSSDELYSKLCQNRNKLDRFWEALTHKLQPNLLKMTHTH